eukprot:6212167-Pleurochrysis_carterae.AAC.2
MNSITGIVYGAKMPAAAQLLVDVSLVAKLLKGSFSQPHLQHVMCIHACADTLFYQRARGCSTAGAPAAILLV